jgi:hypothetical protein
MMPLARPAQSAHCLTGVFAFSLYDEFAQFSAFAWTWPTAGSYQYVAVWSIVAAVCFLHLREIGPSRLVLKGALVAALLATTIAGKRCSGPRRFPTPSGKTPRAC